MEQLADHAATVDEPDYSTYSLKNLYYVRKNIDRDHYEHRLSRVEAEIEKRHASMRETATEAPQAQFTVAEKLDTRSRRVGAFLIDLLVLLPVAAILSVVAARTGGPVLVVCAVIWILLLTMYSVIGHAKWGGTIGKWFVGVRVTDLREQSAGFGACMLREIFVVLLSFGWLAWWAPRILEGVEDPKSMATVIPMIVLMWTLWWFLELVTMAINERRQSVQDRMAQTLVLRADAVSPAETAHATPISVLPEG